MYKVRCFLPHRRMIGIVFSHPHRTEHIETPSLYYTYNPVIRERRHGKGISRMWQENNIYCPRFTPPGPLDFLIHLLFVKKMHRLVRKNTLLTWPVGVAKR